MQIIKVNEASSINKVEEGEQSSQIMAVTYGYWLDLPFRPNVTWILFWNSAIGRLLYINSIVTPR
jgi:hypothetical protein